MSGGFFRGTSAEQDTRFSNKQAKLLKTQKFASELEHPVDMTKVKMDVMKPWIANRVTELIGIEDEVVINFIYGLLEEKVVDGRNVQIQLTGFMERNTGKFMKELWSLLLSAQRNATGVPQQFLDAKEEETRKKKAETDRIANEIQRRKEKEKREKEQEINKKMDADVDNGRDNHTYLDDEKHQSRAFSRRSINEKEPNGRRVSRGKSRGSESPSPTNFLPSLRHRHSRSRSMSFSNSGSHSNEGLRSKSISRSPQSRSRSVSSERRERSLPRRSVSPRRRHSPCRYLSPPRRRPSHSKRRSISPLHYRSPSPARYRIRSPLRRRSRSPMRRRTRSPIRHRSISQSRSVSRSPVWRRSLLMRRQSRSPIRRRSPVTYRRRPPSPSIHRYWRSPSTPHRRSPSPVRRRSPPGRKRLASPVRRRSPSPQDWSSPSAIHHSSPSPIRRTSSIGKRSPEESSRERISRRKYSPTRYSSPSEYVDRPANTHKGSASERLSPDSTRSPQRDLRDRVGSRSEVPALPPSPPSPHRYRLVSESTPAARSRSPNEERSRGSYEDYFNRKKDKTSRRESCSLPPREVQEKARHQNANSSADGVGTKYDRNVRDRKNRPPREVSPMPDKHEHFVDKVQRDNDSSPERLENNRTTAVNSPSDGTQSRKNVQVIKSERSWGTSLVKYSGQRELPAIREGNSPSKTEEESSDAEENRVSERRQSLSNDIKGQHHEPEILLKSSRKVEQSDRIGVVHSGSEESDRHRAKVKDKRKHKRSKREEIASDDGSSSDSHIEDRKEAKRRRKEEKRLKKEERRRRREERRRRRKERRAEKRKLKSTNASSLPSDFEEKHYGRSSEDEYVRKRDTRGLNVEEMESEQKKLEIALREKALESLRVKKGIGC